MKHTRMVFAFLLLLTVLSVAGCALGEADDVADTTAVLYTVTLDYGDKAEGQQVTVEAGEGLPLLTHPVVEGYYIYGWYTDELRQKAVDIEGLSVSADITLYAHWVELSEIDESVSYTVTFETLGGGKIEKMTLFGGEVPTLPAEPEKDGVVFAGWYTDIGSWKKPYTPAPMTEDIVLYAYWRAPDYTVRFVLNGGSVSEGKAVARGDAGDLFTAPSVTKAGKRFLGWYTDEALTQAWDGRNVMERDMHLYAAWGEVFSEEDATLPVIRVQTGGGAEIVSKEEYLTATVSISGSVASDISAASARIRGRGNSTWSYFDKKAYRLKFDSKQNLFAMGEAKDWVLLANALDHSLLRNYTMFDLAAKLEDEFTSAGQFVHLIVNGTYRGVYLVCEQVEEGKHRVNIGDGTVGGADVGYLVEFGGGQSRTDGKPWFEMDVIEQGGETLKWHDGWIATLKSPDETVCTAEQLAYIDDYVNRVNKAIFLHDWDTFTAMCDVESFVRSFLINTFFKNGDGGFSFFMYKKAGGVLYLGPHWDYDQSSGSSSHADANTAGWDIYRTNFWFVELMEMPQFYELVKEMWLEYREAFLAVPAFVRENGKALAPDAAMNFACWDVLGKPCWRSIPEVERIKTYEGQVEYLADWFERRIAWIENELQIK